MSKRKKPSPALPETPSAENESVTTQVAVPQEGMAEAAVSDEAPTSSEAELTFPQDSELTVDLRGDEVPGRDELDATTVSVDASELGDLDGVLVQRKHLRGLLEALVFASDSPIKTKDIAKLAQASVKQVGELLLELRDDYQDRGINLEEVAGGWVLRTNVRYAPFVRDLTKQKPVRLSRAQVETLAIIAYRQPITRPEMDDVRGVDSGPVLKLLLERDLIRILGKRDEPGRPLIYGTTNQFLEFFGLKSLKDLPTLREFTELSEESRDVYEAELGEPVNDAVVSEATDENGPAPNGSGGDEHAPADSMRIPISEQPLSDFGDDDLEALSDRETKAEEEHGAEHDDPTLDSEAPPAMDPEELEDER